MSDRTVAQGGLGLVWETLWRAFHETESRLYYWVQAIVGILIVVSVVLFLTEFSVADGSEAASLISIIDTGLLWIFIVEITLRSLTFRPGTVDFFKHTRESRLRAHVLGRLYYMAQPLNLADLMAVLAIHPALRGLRALRLLRLVRTARLFRYSNPFSGMIRAVHDNRLLFVFAFTMLGLSTLLGGLTMYLIESANNGDIASIADGLWWALVTVTTVGFGDITPVSGLGRIVGGILMIAGMFTLAMFAGIVGHTLMNALLGLREEQFRVSAYLNHVVICGYDAGAHMLLGEIVREFDPGKTDIVIFSHGERPREVPPELHWVDGDPSKESELDKARLQRARAAIIVGARDVRPEAADATSILITFTIRRYLKKAADRRQRLEPLYIITEILDAENVDHAFAAGANEVIETTRLGFSMLAHAVAMPGSGRLMSAVAASGAHSLYVGKIPEGVELPTSFEDLLKHLKRDHDVLLIGIQEHGEKKEFLNPPRDMQVTEGMDLFYLAEGPVLELVGSSGDVNGSGVDRP